MFGCYQLKVIVLLYLQIIAGKCSGDESINKTSIKLGNRAYFMKFLLLSGFCLIFNYTSGQPVVLSEKQFAPPASRADSLIREIQILQQKNSSFYYTGQFSSQRGKRKRDDHTVFFSALISFTLKGIANQVDPVSQNRIDSIRKGVQRIYPYYLNMSGRPTYNFWPTNPPAFFPNSKFLSARSRYQIPDDADCSALIYLTDTAHNSPQVFQNLLTHYANLSKKKIKNTFRKYRDFKAYSTWFGKNMPLEFDICVQSNALYFIYEHHLPLTPQDSATILLLKKQILSGDYLRYAYYLSPSYKKRSIVLYHLARLLAQHKITLLEDCRSYIKKDIELELKKTKTYLDRVILSTALIRMDGHPEAVSTANIKNNDLSNYVFFHANFFSSYARPSLRFVCKTHWFDINFYCKAYCLALLTEYEILRCSKNLN